MKLWTLFGMHSKAHGDIPNERHGCNVHTLSLRYNVNVIASERASERMRSVKTLKRIKFVLLSQLLYFCNIQNLHFHRYGAAAAAVAAAVTVAIIITIAISLLAALFSLSFTLIHPRVRSVELKQTKSANCRLSYSLILIHWDLNTSERILLVVVVSPCRY